ncbi:HAD-IIIC family phosphatase [Lentzea tibetensis]|uniref:HAD-IIIC family phosphatase n=1 Tax=Lentzea tibetensis TaxID=2591470 RepID=A0A563EJ26_9PSEU|nr:HAD-IIIC family phosphatase [Lentzea tibetensis]TWP46670.1 HAD-IIIC family phosphatase [Lentzea tibetensis]
MANNPALVKCLVWDLDNTLWKGTLLEDGEVHLPEEVRDVVVELDSRGVLQSISSKNDSDLALARLRQFGLAEYFVLPKIGWGPKSDSVRAIADELKFALGTIAFIDDQPAERAEVAYHLPEVRCIPADEVLSVVDLPEFTPAAVTVDSRRRREMYQASFEREAEQAAFKGPDEDFLRSLDLVMRVDRADAEQLTRVEELTLRTSQMNATGVHYSDAVLRELMADPEHEVLVTTLTDRFGPHGAVGVMLVAKQDGLWHLKLLATSCRVVSFGVGAALLNWIADQAARAGVHLVADFRRTERNRMMEIAYRFAGFTEESCDCVARLGGDDGTQRLHLIPDRRPAPATMRVITPELTEA